MIKPAGSPRHTGQDVTDHRAEDVERDAGDWTARWSLFEVGSRLVGYGRALARWRLARGHHLRTLAARDGAIAFTPGGRQLVTGGKAGTVTIRDVPSGTVVRRLRFSQPVPRRATSGTLKGGTLRTGRAPRRAGS